MSPQAVLLRPLQGGTGSASGAPTTQESHGRPAGPPPTLQPNQHQQQGQPNLEGPSLVSVPRAPKLQGSAQALSPSRAVRGILNMGLPPGTGGNIGSIGSSPNSSHSPRSCAAITTMRSNPAFDTSPDGGDGSAAAGCSGPGVADGPMSRRAAAGGCD